MKTIASIVLSLVMYTQSYTQELNESSFNFWIGHWEVTWTNPDGSEGKGKNQIVKILDEKVIQENFTSADNTLKGMSLSVYNPKTQNWHQAWADNNGSYFDFVGELVDGVPIFKTQNKGAKGENVVQRMKFKSIKQDSFTWIWEGTNDGGKTWNELWKINYRRIQT